LHTGLHTPSTHEVLTAFVAVHAWSAPQAVPQEAVVPVAASQPSCDAVLQFSVPAAQATHVPLVHIAEDPQFVPAPQPQLVSVLAFSQPFAALPSQSSALAAQATHTPPEQYLLDPQTACVQPQSAPVSVCSQPFAGLLSQSVVEPAHAVHVPVVVLQDWACVHTVCAQPQLPSPLICSQPLA
jgi:hypothetical protein